MHFNIKKIKKAADNFVFLLGRHVMLDLFVIVIFSAVIGAGLYYAYVYLAENEKIEVAKDIGLNEDVYKKVVEHWKKEEADFNQPDSQTYPNPFYSAPLLPATSNKSATDKKQ